MTPASTLRLYGTETSPYVRRVRIVAAELEVAVELVDTKTDGGQAALREVSPIWKVPAAEVVTGDETQLVLDSAVINEHLMVTRGPGALEPHDPTDVHGQNLLHVIDGALDALINVFYLAKDGVEPKDASYVQKQRDRAGSACAWLDARVQGSSLSGSSKLSLADIALATTVGWMQFRATYPIQQHANLMRCYEAVANRPSFQATRPPFE